MSNQVSNKLGEEQIKLFKDTVNESTVQMVETFESIIKKKDAVIRDLQDTLVQIQRLHQQEINCLQEKLGQLEVLEDQVQEAENRYQLRKTMVTILWERNERLMRDMRELKQTTGTDKSTENGDLESEEPQVDVDESNVNFISSHEIEPEETPGMINEIASTCVEITPDSTVAPLSVIKYLF